MGFKHLSSQQLQAWLTEDPTRLSLIDIRDRQSYDAGHIESARHVDNSSVESFLMQSDKLKPLVVCCYHGNSSQGAADYFNAQGFHETYSLDGGYENWKSGN